MYGLVRAGVGQLIVFAGIFVLSGCAKREALVESGEYDVQGIYAQGLKDLRDGEYVEASKKFKKVLRLLTPQEKALIMDCTLRLADTLYFREEYEEAEKTYKRFIDTVGDDPRVPGIDYAYFRLAQCQWMEKGETFFLVPPDDRKDQSHIKKAFRTAQRFLERFPNSPYLPEVRRLYEEISRIRISYNLEVARFYLSRSHPKAAVLRLEYLLGDVPLAQRDPRVIALYIRALDEASLEQRVREACLKYSRTIKGSDICERQ